MFLPKDNFFLNIFNYPIFAINKKLDLVATNKSGAAFLQKKDVSSEKLKCYELIYKRDKPCAYCPLSELISNKSSDTKIISHESKNLQVSFHRDETKPEWEIFCESIIDVTKQREDRESEIRIANLASIGTLISGIAHELNNPVTGINLNLQSLIANLDKYGIESIRERLRLMQYDVTRSLKIISDILSISSPHRQRFITTNFIQTIQRSIDTVKRLYPELVRRIEWQVDGPPINFAYQSEKIERLFFNLFRNSLQKYDYMPGKIEVHWQVKDKICYIKIIDYAGGISEEQSKYLFHPFYRHSSKSEGSGLGLTVCLRIIEEHFGKIAVNSEGVSTIIYVQIPVDLT